MGVLYGEGNELNGHYKRIDQDYSYPVFVGSEFWLRLTGDDKFYFALVKVISDIASEFDGSTELNRVIKELAKSEEILALSHN